MGDATVISALGLFGDGTAPEAEEEALPASPAEWLTSLGAEEAEGAEAADE